MNMFNFVNLQSRVMESVLISGHSNLSRFLLLCFFWLPGMLGCKSWGKFWEQGVTFSPTSGPVGTLVNLHGTEGFDLSDLTNVKIGEVNAIIISRSPATAVVFVMPGTAVGKVIAYNKSGGASSDLTFTVVSSGIMASQQGSKLVGTGGGGPSSQGESVGLSADGNTAIIGGRSSNSSQGAAWIFTRTGGNWSQQGAKLVGTGNTGAAAQGKSVALSADGNTALVGANQDNASRGAAWVFTRIGGVWSQQGEKLVGADSIGASAQGISVSLSADGNTAIVGGPGDNTSQGAAWIFKRTDGIWSQEGAKLVGTGSVGSALQGSSVGISADGNTVAVGGKGDSTQAGAVWIFTRTGGSWSQQAKLVGSGNVGSSQCGESVAVNADGNTVVFGGPFDNSEVGAAWVFTRENGIWYQQGAKLFGAGGLAPSRQGHKVAISADGNSLLAAGFADNSNQGAVWFFQRAEGLWAQRGAKFVGSGNVGAALQGLGAALSADGNTALVGGPDDNSLLGASWVWIP